MLLLIILNAFLSSQSCTPSTDRVQILSTAQIPGDHHLRHNSSHYAKMSDCTDLEKYHSGEHSNSTIRRQSIDIQRVSSGFVAMCAKQFVFLFSVH